MALTLDDPNGLVNLRNLAQEVKRNLTGNQDIPIVFVPGFSGWGAPLFGAINYFGGVIDLPKLLVDEGYTVIVAPVAPISTNWERACELYTQLTIGRFSTVCPKTGYINEIYDVGVDYGTYFAADPSHAPEKTKTHGRRRAILFPNSTFSDSWKWKGNKVHFVCHSQGGNTVRYLISLMAKGAPRWHLEYFNDADRDDWTISVTTLGTPHQGTTIVDVIENFVSDSRDVAIGLAARLFATASFYPPDKRTYDLQLDHWGICKKKDETFQDMLKRFESDDGPVWKWLDCKNTGLYDNTIEGVDQLSEKQEFLKVSPKVFYFSLSFHATNRFPKDWPAWGIDALDSFPTNIESFVRSATRHIPILGPLTSILINAFTGLGWVGLKAVTKFRSFVEWLTEAVVTRLLWNMGYHLVLPKPGAYIPRSDVMPALLPFVYAMGGQKLTAPQMEILGPDPGDWNLNDGVVNTESMSGPKGCVKSVASLPDLDFGNAEKKGVYWHLGVSDQMDHADEIGVFIEPDTGDLMQEMYLNIASLISRLPFDNPDSN